MTTLTRNLTAFFIMVVFFLLVNQEAHAHHTTLPDQGQAMQACGAAQAATAAVSPEIGWQCWLDGNYYRCSENVVSPYNNCNQGAGGYYLFTWNTDCQDLPMQQGIFNTQEPADFCRDGCMYEAGAGSCNQDQQGYTCIFDVWPTGDACNDPPPQEEPMPGNCTALPSGMFECDCAADPDAWMCADPQNPPPNCILAGTVLVCIDDPTPPPPPPPDGGGDDEDDPGGQLPEDDPGGPPLAGDGDPDTPDGPGQGSGDINDDGEREIDCDPSSNPDCAWTGQGKGSGDCDVQPLCDGDPVQCAILYQQWATMCYDEGNTVSRPSFANCMAPITCEGDAIKCAILKESREQFCTEHYGNEGEHDPRQDGDFNRDLKEEGSFIDLEGTIDQGAIGGAGTCPADYPISVLGGNFSMSYGNMCTLAESIRPMVIITALIIGYMIIGGRR